ncbi:MAG: hypothetical protein H6509_16175 [Bryobacterales bacterium]|nr:hypothetical protein [Bryobacterales bacterium]
MRHANRAEARPGGFRVTLLFAASVAFTAWWLSPPSPHRTAHAAGSRASRAQSQASLWRAASAHPCAALVGGWTYWVTREEERANLPFFSQPWFVILCAGLYFAICAKASLGVFLLLGLKPPDSSLFGNYIGGAIVILPMLHQIASRWARRGFDARVVISAHATFMPV